jgi:CRISPR/Cas system CMR subunit Cmr4 (Cas7 group RAMP superfamily)
LSFNPNNDLNGYVIAHLNKIAHDNKLSNLKKLTIKDSRKISENLGNLKPMPIRGELKYTRENTVFKNGEAKEKKCKKCNTIKNINLFEKFRNTCLECRGRLRKTKSVVNDNGTQTIL